MRYALDRARRNKNDEFYTRLEDIENEIDAYLSYNPDVFRGKKILLPCDDPEHSNFTKYFAANFGRLGLKQVVSTCFSGQDVPEDELPLFPEETAALGRISVITRNTEPADISWKSLSGSGDFRSPEITALKDEADIVVTNPPFSLFREFIAWLKPDEKQCVLVSNLNAITYKQIFPLFQHKHLWVGATRFNTGMYFYVPEDYEYWESYTAKREIDGRKVARVNCACWFTNIDFESRHKPLDLKPLDWHLFNSPHASVRGRIPPRYDNFDAIDIPYYDAIPSDYDGVMGVPLTFMGHWCPEQFDIVGFHRTDFVRKLVLCGHETFSRILIKRRIP